MLPASSEYRHPWLGQYHDSQDARNMAHDLAIGLQRRMRVFRAANPYATGPTMIWAVDYAARNR